MARICMVVQSYYLVDRRVRKEAEALIEAGHTVDVIGLRDPGMKRRECVNGVQIYRLPLRRKRGSIVRYFYEYVVFFLLATAYVGFLNLTRRYQIVHVHNMPDFLVFSALIPRLLGSIVVLDVHDPMPELYVARYGLAEDHWLLRLIRFQERVSYAFPDEIITVNEPMRERIVKGGIDPEHVLTIFNTPDHALFTPKILREMPANSHFALVFTGTIAWRYGLDLAVRAVALLADEMPDLKLVLVGDGDYLPALKDLVAKLGVEDRVEFLGQVPSDEVPTVLARCQACLSPHRGGPYWDLNFSTKVLESLAVGLPVISARTKTIEAYLEDSLFYFEPEDLVGLMAQVRLLRTSPELVRAKAERAAKIIPELSWDREKTKLQQFTLELTTPPPSEEAGVPDEHLEGVLR